MKRISLQHIANKAGVSKVTVSAALNGLEGVSEQKRMEIRRIADQLGYSPNAAARLLKQKNNSDIGLVIFELGELIQRHSFFSDLLYSFLEECSKRGIYGHFEWSDYNANPKRIPSLFTNGLAGSILIAGTPSAYVEKYIQTTLSIPVVRIIENGKYSILPDSRPGIRDAIQYLAALGHRDIAMINGPSAFRIYRESREAFSDALSEFGIAFQEKYFAEFPEKRSADNFKIVADQVVLRHKKRPTALLLPGDGSKTILYYLAAHGIIVPRDISAITFVTTHLNSESISPKITSIDDLADEFVQQGLAMLGQLRNGCPVPDPNPRISAKFHLRETVLNAKEYKREEIS